MKELSFNGIKKEIHLKPFVIEVKRKDNDYYKIFNGDKLTFYKDYKSKMIWFNSYGIGWENTRYYKKNEGIYLIETNKTILSIKIQEVEK